MKAIELTGVIHSISEKEEINDNFYKRELILRVTEISKSEKLYHHYIPIQFTNRKSDCLIHYKTGENVEVVANITGKLAQNGRAYVTVDAWKINRVN